MYICLYVYGVGIYVLIIYRYVCECMDNISNRCVCMCWSYMLIICKDRCMYVCMNRVFESL